MTALYIIGGILLFFILVGFIRAEAVISFAEEFGLVLRVCGIPIRLFPKKPKKIRLRDYTPRAMKRKRRREEKKALKKQKKEDRKAAKKQKEEEASEKNRKAGKKAEEKKTDLPKLLSLYTAVAKTAVTRFGKALRVRVARLHIAVAAEDAAKTALLYGAVSQGVCYLAALLDATSTLRHPAKADVRVYADYLANKPAVDLEIGFSLRVYQMLDLLLRSAGTYIRQLIRLNSQ